MFADVTGSLDSLAKGVQEGSQACCLLSSQPVYLALQSAAETGVTFMQRSWARVGPVAFTKSWLLTSTR